MLLLSRLRSLLQRQTGPSKTRFWGLVASRPAKITCGALVAAVILAWLWFRVSWSAVPGLSALTGYDETSVQEPQKGRLHLLIPATSSGPDLCKLLLSAQILGWPVPVLINYGDREDPDPYVQHLAKVQGILNYLEQLEHDDDYAEDLVLIIDGYDIWFQLRPDVLIKRYYETNAAANRRAVETYGQRLVNKHDIRQSVLFGPDKLCWPVDFARPACWAVPESGLPADSYGPRIPHTMDREKNDARWLNSGTVLGNVQDLKDVFQATLDEITTNYVTDSDQFYFANIFGVQEAARIGRKPELQEKMAAIEIFDIEDNQQGSLLRNLPMLDGNVRTEYHIGLDYESSMFQTLAYWKQHLAWLRPIDSWLEPEGTSNETNMRHYPFPEDIGQSLPPFEPFKYGIENAHTHRPSWSEVPLLYNVITKQFPVLFHVTGNPDEKNLRYLWWQRIWFQAEAEKLRLASLKLDQHVISPKPIHGIYWFNAEVGDAEEIELGGKGGVWTDRGGWMSWSRVCKNFEKGIFDMPGEELYHPVWKDPTK